MIRSQGLGFIKLNNRKLFFAGISIAVIGIVLLTTSVLLYIVQSVDSSKMASFDYEISKPVPLDQTSVFNQGAKLSNKSEPKAITQNNQGKTDSTLSKSMGSNKSPSNQEGQSYINSTENNSSSSAPIISKKSATAIIATPTPVPDNTMSLTSQPDIRKATSSPSEMIVNTPTQSTKPQINEQQTEQSKKKLNPATVNITPALDKGHIDINLFSPISAFSLSSSDKPKNLFIPIIDLSATIKPLNITILNQSLSWETPNRIVGHIPITSTPGELNQGWYFGHYETLLTNEGNIFNDLPEIVDFLKSNRQVFVMINSGNHQFLYQVYKTEVVHQDLLQLTNSQIAEITLVTCVPKYKYDHRLLVTASLIGVRNI